MRRLEGKLRNLLLILASTAVLLLLIYKLQVGCNIIHKGFLLDCKRQMIQYDRNMPVIIIGGVHHSGADLLQAILDAHSVVRCDEEISANYLVLSTFEKSLREDEERLDEAGVTRNVLDSALAAFFLETLALNGEPARWLCTNSQFMLKAADHVSKILPKAKFIFVVRDGRAVVHSIISSQITLKVYNISHILKSLKAWNEDVYTMYYQCKLLGKRRCMLVYYEILVLYPETLIRKILSFLEVPWDKSVLHRETEYKRGVQSKKYIDLDSVEDPMKVDVFEKWFDQLPLIVDTLAPMLVTLGYQSRINPLNNDTSDTFLLPQ